MAEIILEDLLRWRRELDYRPAKGEDVQVGVTQIVSWAVTARASLPILPVLRGGEIVIIPPRLLDEVEATTTLRRGDVPGLLAGQPIAALLVDAEFTERPLPGLRLLVTSGAFPHDAEAVLNRLLTERRAELYQLGAALSRGLSNATIAGAGLDALLDAAARLGKRRLLLLDGDGALVADSAHGESRAELPGPQQPARWPPDSCPAPARLVDPRGVVWLAAPVRLARRPGARREREMTLAIEAPADGSTEAERLILSQTAGALELLLGQSAPASRADSERASRDALLLDLLLGRLASRQSAEARARLLGLEPARGARVVVARSRLGGLAERMRAILPNERRIVAAALSEHEFAVLLTHLEHAESDWRDLHTRSRALIAQDASLVLALSETAPLVTSVGVAVEQARRFARLVSSGVVPGPALDLAEPESAGLHGLLYPLVAGGDPESEENARRLDRFASAWLGVLEAHDRRRSGDLVRTLAAYLELGGALAEAAERLQVHRNTVAYRLRRIIELTGRDVADQRVRLLLQSALVIRDLQRVSADD